MSEIESCFEVEVAVGRGVALATVPTPIRNRRRNSSLITDLSEASRIHLPFLGPGMWPEATNSSHSRTDISSLQT